VAASTNPATNRAARRTAADASPPDMSIQDTARYLGLTPKAVRSMISDGRLRAYRLGARVIRLRRSEIDAALRRVDESA
jgi:excisionase family DNA binding protein